MANDRFNIIRSSWLTPGPTKIGMSGGIAHLVALVAEPRGLEASNR